MRNAILLDTRFQTPTYRQFERECFIIAANTERQSFLIFVNALIKCLIFLITPVFGGVPDAIPEIWDVVEFLAVDALNFVADLNPSLCRKTSFFDVTNDCFGSTAHLNDTYISSDTRLRIGYNREDLAFAIPFHNEVKRFIWTGENPCLEHRPMADWVPIDGNNGITRE